MHVVHFMLQTRIYDLLPREVSLSQKTGEAVTVTDNYIRAEKALAAQEKPEAAQHYIRYDRQLYMKHMWVWVINLLVSIAMLIAFILIDGAGVVTSLYIPLDFLLNLAKYVFFFYYRWNDARKKQEEEKVKEMYDGQQLRREADELVKAGALTSSVNVLAEASAATDNVAQNVLQTTESKKSEVLANAAIAEQSEQRNDKFLLEICDQD